MEGASAPNNIAREGESSLRRLASLLRPFAWWIGAAVVMLICLAGLNMVMPLFVAWLIDYVFPDQNWTLLWWILAGILATYLLRNLLYFGSKYTAVRVGETVCFGLRNRLFQQMQRMSLSYYRRQNPGNLSSRVMNDSYVVQQFIQEDLPKLMQAVFLFIGLVAGIYAVNWPLALAATVVLPLHFLTYRLFRNPIKAASSVAQEHLAVAQGNLIEKILGVEVVKGFTAENRENQSFREAVEQSRRSSLRSKTFHVLQKIVADLLVGLGTVALLAFGTYQVISGAMKPGTFMAFFGLVLKLYPTVQDLISNLAKMTRSTASVDRVFEMLDAEMDEEDAPASSAPVHIHGNIEFDAVTFSYDQGPPVLRSVSFKVRAGQVCGIIGPSGAGKSTLVSLIPRFNEPTVGRVLLDGQDVRSLPLRQLRQAVGIAFQECFLFNSSVLENLHYARPEASINEVIAVARATGAHDFITRLPNGYDTIIGQKGVSLSRGEKQRITLTRAMLKNPRILILDEATASIDSVSAARIIPEILRFMKGKTTLMISHRHELLRHADVVLRLKAGRAEYFGPCDDELLQRLLEEESAAMLGSYSASWAQDSFGDPLGADEPPSKQPPARRAGDSHIGTRFANVLLAAITLWTAGLLMAPAAAGAAGLPDAAPPPPAGPAPPPLLAEADNANQAPDNANENENANNDQNDDQQEADPQQAPEQAEEEEEKAEPEGRFIAVPRASEREAEEIVDVVAAHLEATLGYRRVRADPEQLAVEPPGGIRRNDLIYLAAQRRDGPRRVMQLGYRSFISQPVHIWISGHIEDPEQPLANPDIDRAVALLDEAREYMGTRREELGVGDLKTEMVTLSHVEPDRALGVLRSLGYQTVQFTDSGGGIGQARFIEPDEEIDPENLPVVVAMPDSDGVDLVGGTGTTGGGFGLEMVPGVASELPHRTSSAPMMQLMVLHDPAQPQQYARLLQTLREKIDRPAKQILIEAMVIEISESGLQRLGVQWELESPGSTLRDLTLGRLPVFDTRADEEATLDIEVGDIFGEFNARIQALVRTGEAEIISRPSVLTLDNRQASIRVGEDIPIATSVSGVARDQLRFDFDYLPIGILLNVRPRASAQADQISMQIDAIVSDRVRGEDLIITDQGVEVARAPRISTRRVQTYSRIHNNTPFIIGGLINRQMETEEDKVPVLGDVPLLGHLFRSSKQQELRREVIIVLTPYVLPDDRTVGRVQPRDEDLFDSFGHRLFRDEYRIRAEDVFDLTFLTENPQLQRARRQAHQAIERNPELAETYPFDRFEGNRIPGEQILVYRQVYEVLRRKGIDENVGLDQLIFFMADKDRPEGYRVEFLMPYLAQLGGLDYPLEDPSKIFDVLDDQALAITFTTTREGEPDAIFTDPVPRIRIYPCRNRQEWSRLLWQLNQPDADGNPRHTILLHTQRDVERVQQAVALKRAIEINANREELTLENFSHGQVLHIPDIDPETVKVLDARTADYFFFTEQYYPALQRELTRDINALRQAINARRVQQHRPEPEQAPADTEAE